MTPPPLFRGVGLLFLGSVVNLTINDVQWMSSNCTVLCPFGNSHGLLCAPGDSNLDKQPCVMD